MGCHSNLTYYNQDLESARAAWEQRHKPVILPEYDPKKFATTKRSMRMWRKKWKGTLTPYTHQEYVQTMRPQKRKKYERALHHKPSSFVTSFVKMEKMSTEKYKAPRLIQGRTPAFNIHYGSYIKKLEHALYHRDWKSRQRYAKMVDLYGMAS